MYFLNVLFYLEKYKHSNKKLISLGMNPTVSDKKNLF